MLRLVVRGSLDEKMDGLKWKKLNLWAAIAGRAKLADIRITEEMLLGLVAPLGH